MGEGMGWVGEKEGRKNVFTVHWYFLQTIRIGVNKLRERERKNINLGETS